MFNSIVQNELKKVKNTILESTIVDTGYTNKKYINENDEVDQISLNDKLVDRMLHDIISKSRDVEFSAINKCKGDVTAFEYFDSLNDSLLWLSNLSKDYKIDFPEVLTVRTSLEILESKRYNFMRAHDEDNGVIMLIFNSILLGIIVSTSMMLSYMVDFIKKPNSEEFVPMMKDPSADMNKYSHILALQRFNEVEAKGDLKALFEAKELKASNLIGPNLLALSGGIAVIGVLLVILPLIKEIIYQYYLARIKISDYCQAQVLFLNSNVEYLQNKDPKKYKSTIKKQKEYIKKFDTLSAKMRIGNIKGSKKAKEQIEKERIEDVREFDRKNSNNNIII